MSQNFAFWQSLAVKRLPKIPFEEFTKFAKKNLVYVNCRYMKYLIFEVSRICADGALRLQIKAT